MNSRERGNEQMEKGYIDSIVGNSWAKQIEGVNVFGVVKINLFCQKRANLT